MPLAALILDCSCKYYLSAYSFAHLPARILTYVFPSFSSNPLSFCAPCPVPFAPSLLLILPPCSRLTHVSSKYTSLQTVGAPRVRLP
jgi:hypothetical protein